jgi:hypothetical protein
MEAGVDVLEHCTFVTETGIDVCDAVVADLVESAIPVCLTPGVAPGRLAQAWWHWCGCADRNQPGHGKCRVRLVAALGTVRMNVIAHFPTQGGWF